MRLTNGSQAENKMLSQLATLQTLESTRACSRGVSFNALRLNNATTTAVRARRALLKKAVFRNLHSIEFKALRTVSSNVVHGVAFAVMH